jgi:DNA-binding response OmpR family regulator
MLIVVDDDADLRDGLAEVLVDEDRVVQKACDGDQALALISLLDSDTPCVVVTDLEMPGMDGLTLIRAIRRDLSLAQVRILVFSARPTEAARAAADATLEKPCELSTLRDTIDALFSDGARTRGEAAPRTR